MVFCDSMKTEVYVMSSCDQMRLYETSESFDCTFRVEFGSNPSEHKDFKCHRLILSEVSDVFRAMLTGGFMEARLSPDEPILLSEVEPDIFNSAMRFVYGQEKDFKSVSFAIELFKFGDRMQITSLTHELDKFFHECEPSEILAVFDFYKMLEHKPEWCRQFLARETEAALKSDHWLGTSMDGVLEFLSMDWLNMPEECLVAAVVDWGQHQLKSDGDDPGNAENLRDKILPLLKLIRFAALDGKIFTQMCLKELGGVLSKDEKFAISESISKQNCNLLPTGFCQLQARQMVFEEVSIVPELVKKRHTKVTSQSAQQTITFQIKVNKRAELLRLGLLSRCQNFTIELKNAKNNVVFEECALQRIGNSWSIVCPGERKCILEADTVYKVTITCLRPENCAPHVQPKPFSLAPNQSFTSGWLTLTVVSSARFFDLHWMALTFKNNFSYP